MSPSIFTIAVTLFVTMNSIGNLGVFISLLKKYPPKRQARIIVREMIFALLILLIFTFLGDDFLRALGISTDTVSIGGGIILFLLALGMIFPKPVDESSQKLDYEPFIVPLATPVIVGGGTLATAMAFSYQVSDAFVLFFGILIAWIFNTIVLVLAPLISRVLSGRTLMGIERLMGLVLTLIAAQMILGGATRFVKNQLDHPPAQQNGQAKPQPAPSAT